MSGLGARVAAAWRTIWTPRAAREVEDGGAAAVAAGMPVPPPVDDQGAGLAAVRARLDAIEHRNRVQARLAERRREEESPSP